MMWVALMAISLGLIFVATFKSGAAAWLIFPPLLFVGIPLAAGLSLIPSVIYALTMEFWFQFARNRNVKHVALCSAASGAFAVAVLIWSLNFLVVGKALFDPKAIILGSCGGVFIGLVLSLVSARIEDRKVQPIPVTLDKT
jgi:xanthine/uracil permease